MPRPSFRHEEHHVSPTVVLKDNQLFYVWTPEASHRTTGLFFMDTHYLNRLEWLLDGHRPVLLSATVSDGTHADVDLTNAELMVGDLTIGDRSIHVLVSTTVADRLYQTLSITSYFPLPIRLPISLRLETEFQDLFEVRGIRRKRRGTLSTPTVGGRGVGFHYTGRDGVAMHTLVHWNAPTADVHTLADGQIDVTFVLDLTPRVGVDLLLEVEAILGDLAGDSGTPDIARQFALAVRDQAASHTAWEASSTQIASDNPVYDAMLRQATLDLHTLSTDYPNEGSIVDAGIPWYVAPFGRDSLITGIESALLRTDTLVHALRFLARHQGTADDPWRDEEPGKMMHEMRRGEMARCHEIPHTPYYGSVDATLWWIIGLAEAFHFTNDRALLEELESPLRAALQWIVQYAHPGGGRMVSYKTRSSGGLTNQGWKDSFDSVLDTNGQPAPPPIALVEVQGYAYRALLDGASLLHALHDAETARSLRQYAAEFRSAFLAAFWDKRQKRVAYALDGQGHTSWAKTSNVGHLLFTSILPPSSARAVADTLFGGPMESGYGGRTLSEDAPGYNPMSYHNGSIWPHDNAIAGWGLQTLGERDRLVVLAQSAYDAAQHFPYGRLPELYGGFARRQDTGPVHYPVACDPQGWAVASPLFFLRLMLGLSANGRHMRIDKPVLPPWLGYLTISGLHVAGGSVDLEFGRRGAGTYANVLRIDGDIRPLIVPA